MKMASFSIHVFYYISWLLLFESGRGINAAGRVKRIVNGAATIFGEFPYEVLVVNSEWPFDNGYLREPFYVCGGSIISDYWILTAAHCLENATAAELHLLAGNNRMIPSSIQWTPKVEKYIVHQNFDQQTHVNDIALIKLKTPFTWFNAVKPIELQTVPQHDLEGTAIVAGWGKVASNGQIATVLQATKVSLLSDVSCRSYSSTKFNGSRIDFNPNLMFCAQGVYTGPCRGDSGSPLVFKGQQIGITAINLNIEGPSKCSPPHVWLYTRVSGYYDWIVESCDSCLANKTFVEPRVSVQRNLAKLKAKAATAVDLKHLVWIKKADESSPTPLCAGSIIAEHWVLTSKSCAEHPVAKLWVRAATNFLNETSSWTPVHRIHVDDFGGSEVALLELEQSLSNNSTKFVKFMPLQAMHSDVTTGPASLLAFTSKPFSEVPPSGHVIKVNVNIAPWMDCQEFQSHKDNNGTTSRYDWKRFQCGVIENLNGDQFQWTSGSPVVRDGVQIGFVVAPQASSEFYLKFARASAYLSWIQKTCDCLSIEREVTYKSQVSIPVIIMFVGVGIAVIVGMCWFHYAQPKPTGVLASGFVEVVDKEKVEDSVVDAVEVVGEEKVDDCVVKVVEEAKDEKVEVEAEIDEDDGSTRL